MGKGRNRWQAKRPRNPNRVERVVPTSGKCIKVVHWNINGLLRDDNRELLAEVLESEQVDICVFNETHLKHGSNDDLSAFKHFTIYSKERAYGNKKWGGESNDYCKTRS